MTEPEVIELLEQIRITLFVISVLLGFMIGFNFRGR